MRTIRFLTDSRKGLKTFSPSKALPDESLSIREIFERYARGLPTDVVDRSPDDGYTQNPRPVDFDDAVTAMDISDLHELAEKALSQEVEIKQDRLARLEREALQKRLDALDRAISVDSPKPN